MGFVQWRPVFYVVGNVDALNNAMLFLDEFFIYVHNATAKETCVDVHITPHTNVSIDSSWDDLTYEGFTLNEATQKPPLGFFEASPIFGKRVATFSIELHGDHSLSIVITQVPCAL